LTTSTDAAAVAPRLYIKQRTTKGSPQVFVRFSPAALARLKTLQEAYGRLVGQPVSLSVAIRRAVDAQASAVTNAVVGDPDRERAELAGLMRCRG
jgi:ribosomal protein L10